MKNLMKQASRLIIKPAIILLLISIPYSVLADPEDPGGDPDIPPAPIDGGVTLLVAAGVAYGIKKLHSKRA